MTAAGAKDDVFEKARAEFLAALPDKEQGLFTPCYSKDSLINEIAALEVFARETSSGQSWLFSLQKVVDKLEPYFKVVDIFVSSNPEHAALVWGSLRAVIKLASNYTSFFDKFCQMLTDIAKTMPDYGEILRLCASSETETDDEPSAQRMRAHTQIMYENILEAIHIATGVFVKPDGKRKKTAAIVGSLIWKPFEARFQDVLDDMGKGRLVILQQLLIWNATKNVQEIQKAAAERDISSTERKNAALERKLAEKERRLAMEARERDDEQRLLLNETLESLQAEIRALSLQYKDNALFRLRHWISAPRYADRYRKALELRLNGTGRWFFEEGAYMSWISAKSTKLPTKRRFGSNALWVQGHPGAGKTVLSAAIIQELRSKVRADNLPPAVYYYIYDHKSAATCTPSDAYRSLVAQLLCDRESDDHLLDQLTFLIKEKDHGQLFATDADLLDILHLCLSEDAVVVLDGIDECTESESLIHSLSKLSFSLPNVRFLFASRVNVDPLMRAVASEFRWTMPRASISLDIHRFLMEELGNMVEDEFLPMTDLDEEEKGKIATRLCHGADGMFLWARLMVNCVRSPFMEKQQRLAMLEQVQQPEGLKNMYERIVSVINNSGPRATNLASKTLTWLTFSIMPLTSRQLRQAFYVQESQPQNDTTGDITSFENSVIMACAGLVEPYVTDPNPECPDGESTLRFIHLSLQELIEEEVGARGRHATNEVQHRPHKNMAVWPQPRVFTEQLQPIRNPTRRHSPASRLGMSASPPVFQPLVMEPVVAHLAMAACCLHQLIYNSPAQPLSGAFNKRITQADLNQLCCFTSYAAVHWTTHLEYTLNDMSLIMDAWQPFVMDLVRLLAVFLAQPAVLSSWLEAYYTAEFQRTAGRDRHPPTKTVGKWIDTVQRTCQVEEPELATIVQDTRETVQSLVSDTDLISHVWGTQLLQTPEVVWDEMTSFAECQLFFSPKSLKMSTQVPEPPKRSRISGDPVATMSRTSSSGKIKTILSVWAPHEVFDQGTFTQLRVAGRGRANDIQHICSGWVATYQVWDVTGSKSPVAKIEIDLDKEDVLHPMRKYLDNPFCNGIDFPLAIGPDAWSFAVLTTVYLIQPGRTSKDSRMFSHNLQLASSIDTALTWTAADQVIRPYSSPWYDLYFSPTGQYLVIHESHQNGHHFRAFQCTCNSETGLTISGIHHLSLSGQINQIQHVSFHPSESILAFYGKFVIDRYRSEKAVFIWDFTSDGQDVVRQGLANHWAAKAMSFSSCGSYLILQPDFPSNAEPVVVLCPKSTSKRRRIISSSLPFASSGQAEGASTDDSSTVESSEESSIQETGQNTQQVIQGRGSSTLTHSSISSSGAEVSLHRYTETGDIQKAKVVHLPRSAQFEGAIHTVIPPQFRDDMFRVSVDVDRKRNYPLVERSDESVPAIIERHPAFVGNPTSHRPTISRDHRPAELISDKPRWMPYYDESWKGLLESAPAPKASTDAPKSPTDAAKTGANTSVDKVPVEVVAQPEIKEVPGSWPKEELATTGPSITLNSLWKATVSAFGKMGLKGA